MKRGLVLGSGSAFSLALALTPILCALGASPGWAQIPAAPQCAQFQGLSQAAAQKASVVQAAMKAKADRKEVCAAMTTFVAAEAIVVKFLEDNKTWCGVPDQVIVASKANHEKSVKFKTAACSDNGPHPKAPSLSDALGTPSVNRRATPRPGTAALSIR